ncbi:hypothetical protein DM01DRAFT_1333421 [Hesseltinella vesiculosa]|uniref:Uncharacterized protein n=1 Tax=Hesseltinella vesiculosa TaxID=101127 RepID=A0A1X2GPX5_9FUNG|nr:hypothetical protein DM01DRAFT_1333421 [Hesseltinella vesiculosa]
MQKWANTKAYAMAAKDNKLVRLPRYYSKDDVLHKIMDALRLSRDDTCFYCGRHLLFATYPRVSTATTATIDHLHPMTPLAALNNRAILSCRMCNQYSQTSSGANPHDANALIFSSLVVENMLGNLMSLCNCLLRSVRHPSSSHLIYRLAKLIWIGYLLSITTCDLSITTSGTEPPTPSTKHLAIDLLSAKGSLWTW